jgi:hypothetical protein
MSIFLINRFRLLDVEGIEMDDSLTAFADAMRSAWSPISTALVGECRARLTALTRADPREQWLADLHAERPASRELFRDPEHGFMLLAHTEPSALYRRPHDHGRAWVVYAVQSGALEIGTYAKIMGPDGVIRLVQRDLTLLIAGEARAYLPGDIHDTRCLDDSSLLFRFTERDLRHEDQQERQITRFVESDGYWTVPTS